MEAGSVDLRWHVVHEGEVPRFSLTWSEQGGPPILAQPTRRGFGSRLIERSFTSEVGGEVRLTYAPTGLTCRIEAPLAAMQEAGGDVAAAQPSRVRSVTSPQPRLSSGGQRRRDLAFELALPERLQDHRVGAAAPASVRAVVSANPVTNSTGIPGQRLRISMATSRPVHARLAKSRTTRSTQGSASQGDQAWRPEAASRTSCPASVSLVNRDLPDLRVVVHDEERRGGPRRVGQGTVDGLGPSRSRPIPHRPPGAGRP